MCIDVTTVLFGAGGHAKVVFDAMQASSDSLGSLFVADDNLALVGQDFFGCKVSRSDACMALTVFRFHVAIGRNDVRRAVTQKLRACGGTVFTVTHPRAEVSRHARVGDGSFLAAGCTVAPAAVLAEGVIVNHGAIVDHDCHVGAYTHIAPNATLGGNVRIGAGVLVGAAAVILPGVSVGDGCTIGAGAVVIDNVPRVSTVVGVPGRVLKKEDIS